MPLLKAEKAPGAIRHGQTLPVPREHPDKMCPGKR